MAKSANAANSLSNINVLMNVPCFNKLFKPTMNKTNLRKNIHNGFILDYKIKMKRFLAAPDVEGQRELLEPYPLLLTFLWLRFQPVVLLLPPLPHEL